MVLPAPGAYGVGMFFLSRDHNVRKRTKKAFEEIVREYGQTFVGWRKVPVNPSTLGITSKACMPYICQAFIQKSADLKNETAFERRLYLIRKIAEKKLRYAEGADAQEFYAASLSCRTIVYKGMLQARQVAELYLDLSDLDYATSVALVHSRYSTNTFPSWERAHPNRYTIHNGEINTILGNQKRMNARQSNIQTDLFGVDVQNVFPIVNEDGSDSAMFDNALEFLLMTGRTLPHSAMMMIPEPWETEYHAVGRAPRVLRVPQPRHGRVGRPGRHLRDQRCAIAGDAGPQRPAPRQLLRDQRRYAHPRQRDRRAGHPAGKGALQRPPASRPYAAGGFQRGPGDQRPRD